MVESGVGLVFIDQLVITLRSAKFVVVNAVHQVVALQCFPFLWGGVAAVEETVVVPACAAEFDPLELVFQVRVGLHVADIDFAPVGAGFAAAVSHVAVIFVGAKQADGSGAFFVHGIGVHEDLLFTVFSFFVVVDGLVLQTIVLAPDVVVANFIGRADAGVVDQLGHPIFEGFAKGNLFEVAEGGFVLGGYPAFGVFGVVVFQPVVVVADFHVAVGVGVFGFFRFGVSNRNRRIVGGF